ncbi:16S rRNA methyltransferase [Psychrobacter urativorans]|uniref:Ribosomal RNA small subunit methyltransferase J n=2 Tax=Psychrobacter urativorans TaxID=45610 RepID=A0A0M4TBZ4_9GAMM|nr:16S rRNA methyltransferase [Psychrobacter urativorans]
MSEPLVPEVASALYANAAVSHCRLFYMNEAQQPQVERLQALVTQHQLSLSLVTELVTVKLNQKNREQLCVESTQPILLLDDKNKLSWLSNGLSVTPEWDKLQRRVVSAGRKTELLLQAAKTTADSQVIDATAGFGHDSLILASTGAQVTMLEQQPIMALLLLAEQHRMSAQPNWQKLMARLQIINTDALSYFDNHYLADFQGNLAMTKAVDVVYLDPMFPNDSYQDSKTGKGAKVGKLMQALHHLASPPTAAQELQLLQSAQAVVSAIDTHKQQGRVIVKRPKDAPLFAQQVPDESWHNEAVRFDGYFLSV